MDELRKSARVQEGGTVTISGLPYKKGERVDIIVIKSERARRMRTMTARDFLKSGLVGMWADRLDIGDSSEFAREFREKAQTRGDRD